MMYVINAIDRYQPGKYEGKVQTENYKDKMVISSQM
jgi:hypothetical protein